jgi:hypothetical protein
MKGERQRGNTVEEEREAGKVRKGVDGGRGWMNG